MNMLCMLSVPAERAARAALRLQEMPIRGHLRPIEVPAEAPQEVADAIDACLLVRWTSSRAPAPV